MVASLRLYTVRRCILGSACYRFTCQVSFDRRQTQESSVDCVVLLSADVSGIHVFRRSAFTFFVIPAEELRVTEIGSGKLGVPLLLLRHLSVFSYSFELFWCTICMRGVSLQRVVIVQNGGLHKATSVLGQLSVTGVC